MGMGDWEVLAQSVVFGLIFSFILPKIISKVNSLRGEKLGLGREERMPKISVKEPDVILEKSSVPAEERLRASERNLDIIEDRFESFDCHLEDDDDDDDDGDWEVVETTELDETFSAALAFVSAAAVDPLSQKVSKEVQLQLYGLYKIATEGPCRRPQPSALMMSARAKWNAWQSLGALQPEDAMLKYIMIVDKLYPSWAAGSTVKCKDGGHDAPGSDTQGPVGPVLGTFIHEEGSKSELEMEAIHAYARDGGIFSLLQGLASSNSVDLKDSEGRTPLHWAVDRGHLNIVKLLVMRNADVNSKDNEGQTPLHYAAMCDREEIAEYLVKHNASIDVKDNDGCTPNDWCESNWSWMLCS